MTKPAKPITSMKALRAVLTAAQKDGTLPYVVFDVEALSKTKYKVLIQTGDARLYEAYAAYRDKFFPGVFTVVLM